ncbi:MAG TPA: endolytic transglycosylase MltG, partial [Caulobacter sp.]|nr:endolytic transglycosylase MltG [Caulobacter sp.]
ANRLASNSLVECMVFARAAAQAIAKEATGTCPPLPTWDDSRVTDPDGMDDRDQLLDELWPKRQKGLPFSTKDEAMTLASIVEKETGVASERPRVAAVFVNRLRTGMRLGSDPTIIYGLTRGRPLGRGILLSELQRQTAYNTYLIDGLPPTPIANPGRAAIAAVLDPPKTDELYFVADGTGGHVFARTLEEHNANVVKWRQIERSRAAAKKPAAPLSGG